MKVLAAVKKVKKAAVACLGMVALAVSSGLLHGAALSWAQAVLAGATVLGVYKVRNYNMHTDTADKA